MITANADVSGETAAHGFFARVTWVGALLADRTRNKRRAAHRFYRRIKVDRGAVGTHPYRAARDTI